MSKGWDDLADLEQAKQLDQENNNLLLVDGTNLAFRYLQRKNYDDYAEDYIRTVFSLGKSYQAKKIICCFDSGASAYRNSIYPTYKDNRKVARTEEEQERFKLFFSCLNETIDQLPYQHFKFKGIEADDVIAYLTKELSPKFDHTWVISSDRDLFQLLGSKVSIFNIYSRKEITEDSLFDATGLTPAEYALSRMIQGDNGDNIIGVEGIGEKRAQALVKEYRTLGNLLASLPIKGKAKYIQNLNNSKDLLAMNERLINLYGYNAEALQATDNYDQVYSLLQKV